MEGSSEGWNSKNERHVDIRSQCECSSRCLGVYRVSISIECSGLQQGIRCGYRRRRWEMCEGEARGGWYRDCIGEQTSGRGVALGAVQIILPPASYHGAPHVIWVCVAMATARAVHDISTCASHLRVFKLSARPRRLAGKLKPAPDPEGARPSLGAPAAVAHSSPTGRTGGSGLHATIKHSF